MTTTLREHIALAGGLVNQGDLTRVWQLSKARVSELCNRPDFPAPVATVGGRRVWAGAEVQAWREARVRSRAAA